MAWREVAVPTDWFTLVHQWLWLYSLSLCGLYTPFLYLHQWLCLSDHAAEHPLLLDTLPWSLMAFNNAPAILSLEGDNPTSSSSRRRTRRRVTSEPCLPERLPTTGTYASSIYYWSNLRRRLYSKGSRKSGSSRIYATDAQTVDGRRSRCRIDSHEARRHWIFSTSKFLKPSFTLFVSVFCQINGQSPWESCSIIGMG